LHADDLEISGRAGNTSARHGYKSIRAQNGVRTRKIQEPRWATLPRRLVSLAKCPESLAKCLESLAKCLESLAKCLESLAKCLESVAKCLESVAKRLESLAGQLARRVFTVF
jgi:type II secretory pathway component PulF